MSERLSNNSPENFIGDFRLFSAAVTNPETIFIYDIDGILANSPEQVCSDFIGKTHIKADAAEIDNTHYLRNLAIQANLPPEQVETAEAGWYSDAVLRRSKTYLYMRPVVRMTTNFYNTNSFRPDNNFVLTSRNPDLSQGTFDWLAGKYREFLPENVLIRKDLSEHGAEFKVRNVREKSLLAPWVVVFEDSTEFTGAILEAGITNAIVVNIPLGKITPDSEMLKNNHLMLVGRYPYGLQAMWPLMHSMDIAARGNM